MPDRRELLGLLGAAGAGLGLGLYVNEEVDFDGSGSVPEPTDDNAVVRMHDKLAKSLSQRPLPAPDHEFEYDRKSWSGINQAAFKSLSAVASSDIGGDVLRFVPSGIDADQLADRLRLGWGVYDGSMAVSTTFGESTVTLEGGRRDGYVYLVVTPPEDIVLAVRAESQTAAQRLATSIDDRF